MHSIEKKECVKTKMVYYFVILNEVEDLLLVSIY